MQLFGSMSEPLLRFSAFALMFLVMALLEVAAPKRKPAARKARRWATNLAITAIDTTVVRLMAALAVPLVAVAAALWAEQQGIGLLNLVVWPAWVEFIVAFVVLDLAVWLQHLASHKVPLLWRLHQMHHSDIDFDVTTAIRFHPVEIGLSMLYKVVWVLALGASALAVVLFEMILNGSSMFNHANIALPAWLDRLLRVLIVTPDMHRVHHSVEYREHDSNYGFNLSVWDRLFATYTLAPEKGHQGMTIGLSAYQTEEPTRLLWCLVLPFRARKTAA